VRIMSAPLVDKRRKSDISPLLENYATYSISTFTEESASMIRVLREMNISLYFERNESTGNVTRWGHFLTHWSVHLVMAFWSFLELFLTGTSFHRTGNTSNSSSILGKVKLNLEPFLIIYLGCDKFLVVQGYRKRWTGFETAIT